MILDSLENFRLYEGLHAGFSAAGEFISLTDLPRLSLGRHEISGDSLYVNVMEVDGHPREEALLEYHRRYIDIQIVLSGAETMGWTVLQDLPEGITFDAEKDCALTKAPVSTWFPVKPGFFAVFFPQDAHAPCCGNGKIRKAVIKVRL
jgi:biofilm protein TabA